MLLVKLEFFILYFGKYTSIKLTKLSTSSDFSTINYVVITFLVFTPTKQIFDLSYQIYPILRKMRKNNDIILVIHCNTR